MSDDVIHELKKILIKENLNSKDTTKYILTKEDLIKFCIKMMKVIREVE